MTDPVSPAPRRFLLWTAPVAAFVGIAMLVAFPLYHRLGVTGDVLGWGPVSAWGPGTQAHADSSGPMLRFADTERADQGVTFLLQHNNTRRFSLDGVSRLSVVASCSPAPCTLELRLLSAPDDMPERPWPWASFEAQPTERSLSVDSFGATVRERGAVAVIVARTEEVRKRDGKPRARAVRIHALQLL